MELCLLIIYNTLQSCTNLYAAEILFTSAGSYGPYYMSKSYVIVDWLAVCGAQHDDRETAF